MEINSLSCVARRIILTNTKRLGRYDNLPINNDNNNNNNNDNSSSQSHFNQSESRYKENVEKSLFGWDNLFLDTKAVHYKGYLQMLIKQPRGQLGS